MSESEREKVVRALDRMIKFYKKAIRHLKRASFLAAIDSFSIEPIYSIIIRFQADGAQNAVTDATNLLPEVFSCLSKGNYTLGNIFSGSSYYRRNRNEFRIEIRKALIKTENVCTLLKEERKKILGDKKF